MITAEERKRAWVIEAIKLLQARGDAFPAARREAGKIARHQENSHGLSGLAWQTPAQAVESYFDVMGGDDDEDAIE